MPRHRLQNRVSKKNCLESDRERKNIELFLFDIEHLGRNYLQLLCDANSMLENLGSMNIDEVSVGLCTTICRICVSRPLWWLARTAIWIIHVLMGLERASRVGTTTHPAGSWISNDRSSTRLLWLMPVRMDILNKVLSDKLCFHMISNYFWGV